MIASTRSSSARGVRQDSDERGVALAAAVFALAVMGALVASSFFAGRLEQQSGQSTFFAAQAREAAEAGLSESMAGITADALESIPVGGGPLDLGTILIADGVAARSQVTRLTSRVFLIRADGQRGNSDGLVLATRSLGMLVQLVTLPSSNVARLAERAWVHLY